MIDPQRRWSRHADGKPDYAGLLDVRRPALHRGPGRADRRRRRDHRCADGRARHPTARAPASAARDRAAALRTASTSRPASTPSPSCASSTTATRPCPGRPRASHAAIERDGRPRSSPPARCRLSLGGDHSITEPEVRAGAAAHGPVGLVHFDTHTDTGADQCFGASSRTARPCTRLVERGLRRSAPLRADRPARLLAGRGGVRLAARARDHLLFRPRRRATVASRRSSSEPSRIIGPGPALLTVDVDALDPAFAPGTGTPEPGGMTSTDLLWACRSLASRLDLVGSDVVEVLPTMVGGADITALVADRVIRESLTGVALRRRAARYESARTPRGGPAAPGRAGC